MPAYFRITSSADGLFVFSLMSANHRSILESTIFRSRDEALRAIARTRESIAHEASVERRVARDGKHYFVLVSESGEPLGSSSRYRDAAALETGLRAVRAEALTDDIRGGAEPAGRVSARAMGRAMSAG